MSPDRRDRDLPAPDGCRWCQRTADDHEPNWMPAVGWHQWAAPTDEQRLARMKARREKKEIA